MYVCTHIYIYITLAQDKGGPSKGGFLNNRSFSYTDLYVCNESISFRKINDYSGNHIY